MVKLGWQHEGKAKTKVVTSPCLCEMSVERSKQKMELPNDLQVNRQFLGSMLYEKSKDKCSFLP